MANEFIARKGLIALDDTQITGSLGVSSTLSIPGFTNVSASLAAASGGSGDGFPFTGSAGISGSLELIGSGSTLFNIVGSEGTLFSITDSLSGSLFAVSDVSGLPILEVFSDDTVKIGSFNDEAITVSGSHTTIGGVLAIPGFTNVSASLAAATAGGGTITGVTAGDGLTGGGSAGTVTLNVVGGTGITANANDIAVDATIATVVQLNASSSALQSNIDTKASITQLNASSSALQTNIDTKASIAQLNASSSALQSNIDGKQDTLTFGKLSGNALKSEEELTTNDVLLMGSSNVKGRTYAELKSDLSLNLVENTALSTYTGDGGALDNQYITNGAGYTTNTGTVDTSGTPIDNDFAKFTDANTVEGRSYSEVKTDLSLNNVENTALSTYTGNGGSLDNQYITNGAGYTTNTGTATSVGGTGTVSGLSLSGTVTTSGNLTLGGTISISSTNITDVDAFSQSGTYASLRAQGTTADDVSLGNVTNESKATMFTSPTFTGTMAIPGFSDVSASLAAASGGGGGDITGVTAGNGLTGGGSSGDVTLTVGAGTGVTVNSGDIAIGQDVSTTSNVTFASIVADNVKASGESANALRILDFDGDGFIQFDGKLSTSNTVITIGDPDDGGNGTKIKLTDAERSIQLGTNSTTHVTASGNISASGTITGNSIVGTLATAAQTNITSLGTLGSLTMGGDIDMDGQTINTNNGQIDNASEISSNAFKMGVGGVSTPALAFTSDANTGLYAVAADTLGIAAGGTNRMTIGNGTTTFSNNNVTMALADGDGAVLSITNTYSGTTSADSYAIKAVGNAVIGIPGGQNQAYAGHFTAGNTNTANPDTIALFAQGHEDGAPNSYAAIFSGSAGGVVGINTMEPTVELEVSGDGKFSGALEIGGISDVSASIATAIAGGGGGATTYRTVIESSCFLSQATKIYLPFNSLSEQTSFNYLSITPAAADGQLISITVWPQAGGGSTVAGLHVNSNATATATDTQTLSSGAPATFTFSGATFSQNDELSFSIDPTSNPSGFSTQIVLEYDL